METTLQEHALCRNCRYPLRDLLTPRCPECGREFDPGEPRSMHLPRAMRARRLPRFFSALSQPLKPRIYWFQFAAVLAVVWGFALLPGGLTVAAIGTIGSLAIYLFRHLHRGLQLMLLPSGAVPPLSPASPRYRRAMRVALLLILATHLDLPLTITANLVKISAFHDWRYVPSSEFPRHSTCVGCTFAGSEGVGPDGVRIDVFGGGVLRYFYIASKDEFSPAPYARWGINLFHGSARPSESETRIYSF
jgi:hypothetical protein